MPPAAKSTRLDRARARGAAGRLARISARGAGGGRAKATQQGKGSLASNDCCCNKAKQKRREADKSLGRFVGQAGGAEKRIAHPTSGCYLPDCAAIIQSPQPQ